MKRTQIALAATAVGAACLFAAGLALPVVSNVAPDARAGHSLAETYLIDRTSPKRGSFTVYPDLVKVIATNDREGYVHRDEYREALKPASSLEEALALMAARREQRVQAFACSLAESGSSAAKLPASVCVRMYDEVEQAVTVVEDGKEPEPIELIMTRVATEYGVGATEVARAYDAAIQASTTVLTVYELDGMTPIGSYEIS